MPIKASILVLSPHLDDAALSCSDYLLQAKKKESVFICTVFTNFKSACISSDSQLYLTRSGFTSLNKFHKQRIKEDQAAMKWLGFSHFFYLNFIDGGFRENKAKPVYPTHTQLFSGKIHSDDNQIMKQLLTQFTKIQNKIKADIVLIPMALGKHVDHIMVRCCAEKIWPKYLIRYYVDWPYGFYGKNWNQQVVAQLLQTQFVKFTSQRKRQALYHYTSQINSLFKKRMIWYPEIITRQTI